MQDTPLKSFRPTVKVAPFNYHSMADALHCDVMSPDGWPNRKWSRGSYKLLLQGRDNNRNVPRRLDWLVASHLVRYFHNISTKNFSQFHFKTTRKASRAYFHGNLLPRRWGQPILPRTSVASYQTIRRHIPEESNLHKPPSSVTMTSSHRLSCKLFPFRKNFPVEILYALLVS